MYMSPEQAEMSQDNIDTRSDVYSLGVLLYELIIGALPFDPTVLRTGGFSELQRLIRHDETPKPSTRLLSLGAEAAEAAKKRRTDPTALAREVRGDLDWITLKALEKERGRRYDSPKDLAEDLERHLTDRPVLAGPPTVGYRTKKFVRRHAAGVVAGVVSLLVLIVFAVTMTIQAKRIAAERDLARKAQAELEQVAEFQAKQLSEIDVPLMGVRLRNDLLAEVRAAMERVGADKTVVDKRISTFEGLLPGVNFTDLALADPRRKHFSNGSEDG